VQAGTGKAELYALPENMVWLTAGVRSSERYAHNEREIFAELKLPAEAQDGFVLHPSMMDGVFQAVTVLSVAGLKQTTRQFIPFYVETVEIVNPTGMHCFVHATVNPIGGELLSFDATLCDAEGNVLVSVRNLQKRPLADRRESVPRDVYYRPMWRRRDVDAGVVAAGTLLVFADDDSDLGSFGGETIVVRHGDDYENILQELKDKGQPVRVAWLRGLNVRDDGDIRNAMDAMVYGIPSFTQRHSSEARENVTLLYVHPPGASLYRWSPDSPER
jgi:hypothetical protein